MAREHKQVHYTNIGREECPYRYCPAQVGGKCMVAVHANDWPLERGEKLTCEEAFDLEGGRA